MAFHNLKTKMFCMSDFLAHTGKPDSLIARLHLLFFNCIVPNVANRKSFRIEKAGIKVA
jgi:hypothetical protein